MLFGRSDARKSKSKVATQDKPNQKSMMNKSNKVGLIDSKRQHNLSITLSSFYATSRYCRCNQYPKQVN